LAAPAPVVGITPSSETVDESNKGSSLSFMKGFLPKYFSSEWSYAQFRVGDSRCICAFGHEPGTIIGTACFPCFCFGKCLGKLGGNFDPCCWLFAFAVLTAEGGYFKANFDKGGEMEKMQYVKFIKTPGEPA
jgi:hypothetical protein